MQKYFKLLIPLVFFLILTSLYYINSYSPGILGTKTHYKLVLIGDSMTANLGDAKELQDNLKKYYPSTQFEILNYGFGSTNILSLPERFQKESSYSGQIFKPILNEDFDLIFIESMAHNPLSEYPLVEGLKKQTDTLEEVVKLIKTSRPKSKIIFVATIAPSKTRYGEGTVVLMPEKRGEWANERISYLKNHIEFAKSHRIPLINVYEKSLNEKGDLNIDYVNTHDFIHPSPTGIKLINEEIAKFIYKNRLI